jgi:hypothetical protein
VKFAQIRWGRVAVGGFLAELCVFAIVFPVKYEFGQTAFLASIVIACAVMPFLSAMWVCRRVESGFMLHGALVGIAGVVLYLIVARGNPGPLLYVIAHGLKIVGGAAGGLVMSRWKQTGRNLAPGASSEGA